MPTFCMSGITNEHGYLVDVYRGDCPAEKMSSDGLDSEPLIIIGSLKDPVKALVFHGHDQGNLSFFLSFFFSFFSFFFFFLVVDVAFFALFYFGFYFVCGHKF